MSAAARSRLDPPQSAALAAFAAQWRARDLDPLHEWREQAMQRFLRLGLPTTRDESWRYTNLRRLTAVDFVAADASPDEAAPADPAWASGLPSGAVRIDLVNGYPQLRSYRPVAGLRLTSLRDLARKDAAALHTRLAALSDSEHQRWALLNAALFVDGLHLCIDAELDTPLLLVHRTHGATANTSAFPRILIDAAPGSRATIIEQHVDTGPAATLCNSATQIAIAPGGRIEHYRVFAAGAAATNIDTLDIRLAANSRCKQFTVALGGALLRTNLEAHLDGAGAELDSFSLLVGHGTRHVDCVNVAGHHAPHTQSRQTARAIAGGTSRVIFNSKVVVDAGAAHAESQQSSRGLLLSSEAEIDTRPQLEIHTDEVKCAHGATTGRLDPNMLFYMLSRGVDRATAQSLLVYAFLADVLTGMSAGETRAAVEAALIDQLPDSELLREFR
jgi:Fe-S cluster assembly protein SufD